MGQPIPAQHPSVVLRSHFNLVRSLLVLAMVAVCALAAVVVILANDEDKVSSVDKAAPAAVQPQTHPGTRFDGGPEEGTRGLGAQQTLPPGTRFDGGPEEGTRGARSYYESPNPRSSYQPAPADKAAPADEPAAADVFKDRSGGPATIPQGPGAR